MKMNHLRIWSVKMIGRMVGVYLLISGVAVLLVGDGHLQSVSYAEARYLAGLMHVPVSVLLFLMLVIPGMLIMVDRFRKAGLFIAVMVFSLLAVASARGFNASDYVSIMAPITYAFVAILSGWLLSMERFLK